MQLVVKYSADAYGGPHDLVVASYDDGATVPIDQFPGSVLLPFSGALEDLDRIGPEPDSAQISSGLPDMRPRLAPPVDLLAYAAARRYAVETGGIVVNGTAVRTDIETQNRIANADAYVQRSGAASVSYKTPEGFVTLSADQVKALALAIGAHVQACFATEAGIAADLGKPKPKIKAIADVDAAFAAMTA